MKLLALAALVTLFLAPAPKSIAQPDVTEGRAPSPRVELLLKSGAYDLALRRINEIQSGTTDTVKWLEWENRRYELYRKRREWDKLTERLLNPPLDVPTIKRHELMTHAAELLLDSGRGESVREILRALIWRSGGDSKQLDYWRRLVVRSYLVEETAHDARIAMTLYDREYLPRDAGWDYLFAQVLLRQGDADSAARRLGSVQDPAARVLRLLSRLRSGADSPQLVLNKSAELRAKVPGKSSLVSASWAVTAEAALQAGDPDARVGALEQLFNGPGLAPRFSLFELEVADLWDAYENLGAQLGNAEHLLFGDPGPWIELADGLNGERAALRARAITAAVARRGRSKPELERLHLVFYERLEAAELEALAVRLYESRRIFPSLGDVPDTVRHKVVAWAIEGRDMKRAARFARNLAAPDSDQTRIQWDLTRARLALYAGDFSRSESILRSLVLSQSEFDPEAADRTLQPIFDLQSVGRSVAAFELLQSLYDRVTTPKQKREILMWMGDAKKSDGDYEMAAEFYLRSAFAGSESFDRWGQSAHYRAAGALAEARLFEDARRMYEQLLTIAGEGKRAAALQRRLQELWVKKQEHE